MTHPVPKYALTLALMTACLSAQGQLSQEALPSPPEDLSDRPALTSDYPEPVIPKDRMVLPNKSTKAIDNRPWIFKKVTACETAMLFHGIDWAQTRYIAANPDRFRERNPTIGENPTLGKVNQQFLITGAVFYGLCKSDLLKGIHPNANKWLAYLNIVVHGATIMNNVQIGVGMKF